ncbi:MAG: decarboxylating 6-phosphogluconate dehydrogenase [Sphingomonas sp.]|uniref:phosphogluconate dehydrogenase (NAD(+)-dependent, decarboxylating) n=1 Tax=Sphingomonas sp. TaxID=28214 RepID=UPI001825D687|nr:decarboxylating 6-phosphogluconate dehydrogenase [Sphingomonas sp.]MBA3667417.1 decarboxylating 6-phosphogluconate dehydrogenase [Sphingomonas sp.]
MRIGLVGLGRMGGNMARRLMRGGHEVVAYDHDAKAVAELVADGAIGAASLEEMDRQLASPAITWIMLPAGPITDGVIEQLAAMAKPGDIVIDGGNSFWKDDVRRSKMLAEKGIIYLDVGVSGGVWGLERGYCMMIGGPVETVTMLDPIFATLAPGLGTLSRTANTRYQDGQWGAERGYVRAGPAGSGHFTKMVHNGIEYGIMQSYAEGFDILKQRASDKLREDERFELNLSDIAEVWRRGSVISSWLLDLIALALANDDSLKQFSGRVADSGEGRWTIDAAMEESVPVDVLAASLFARYRSRVEFSYADQLLSAMRYGFGGHVEMPQ